MKNLYLLITVIVVIFSSSLNAQWIQTNFPYNGGINCLAVSPDDSNSQDLFAGTDGAGIFVSTDDGISWQARNNGLSDSAVVNSIGISKPNIFVGNGGMIYHSTNNGASWLAGDSSSINGEINCFAIGDSNIYAGFIDFQAFGGIFRSTNNGASWKMVYSRSRKFVTALIIIDTNVFAGESGLYTDVLRSSDNGTTWIVDDTTFNGGGGINALEMIGSNLFAGTNIGVYLSANNGLSWSPVNNGLPDSVHQYGWITTLAVSQNGKESNNLSAGTDSAGIFLSTNNGTSWAHIGMTNICINALAVTSTNLFAGTPSGIWRRPLSEITSEREVLEGKLPGSFTLKQNYPNPFNPSTTISFSIPASEFVTLKVFDVLGNEVKTLVNEERAAGSYKIDFNASSLASGIYFYKVEAGDFIQTKKMVLLK